MQIVILGNETHREELMANIGEAPSVIWVNSITHLSQHGSANVFIDLLFEKTEERIDVLNGLLPKLVIINSVDDTLAEVNSSFVRINGWSTFLSSNLIEAASLNKSSKSKAEETFAFFGKQIEWLPDIAGFITPRVISMIVNEAYFALAEGVSTPEEIDTAMKLGTAYPHGPLTWGDKIGLQNIVTLLYKLSVAQPRYTPCELLVQQTNKAI